MIKLIKILGSGTNVPEPAKFPIDKSSEYRKGTLYYCVDGYLSTVGDVSRGAKVIILESLPENHGRSFIYGYYVTDNMIFEIDMFSKSANILPGNILPLRESFPGNGYDMADNDVGEDALVVEDDNTSVTGKVIAVLKW